MDSSGLHALQQPLEDSYGEEEPDMVRLTLRGGADLTTSSTVRRTSSDRGEA